MHISATRRTSQCAKVEILHDYLWLGDVRTADGELDGGNEGLERQEFVISRALATFWTIAERDRHVECEPGWARKEVEEGLPRGAFKRAVSAARHSWPKYIQGRPSRTKKWEIEDWAM